MRYLSWSYGSNQMRLGSLQEGYIIDVGSLSGFNTLLDLIKAGPSAWAEVAATLKAVDVKALAEQGRAIPFQDGLVTASLPNPPKNIFCIGRNYYKHYLEGAVARGASEEKPPEAPIYFTKPHTAIIGPFETIPLDPEVTKKLDWEAELGLIIGVGGRKIKAEEAEKHIFGYTVLNDVTARDLQFRHGQWFKGKGLDYSCPMGPVVVTPDELPNPVNVQISLKVNGVTKQSANTGQMMFDIPTLIADLSLAITLEPGDIISTGTPEGVGHFSQPPEYLAAGDVMETTIEGIGTLRNVISTPYRAKIVAEYNAARNALLSMLNRLQPAHYEIATQCPGWSVKDLVAHLTNSATTVQALIQRQLDRVTNPGLAALNERNARGVESRKGRTVVGMMSELIEAQQKNINYYLGLTEEQLQVEGETVTGEIITVDERFRRAAEHYFEHGEMIARATGLSMG